MIAIYTYTNGGKVQNLSAIILELALFSNLIIIDFVTPSDIGRFFEHGSH